VLLRAGEAFGGEPQRFVVCATWRDQLASSIHSSRRQGMEATMTMKSPLTVLLLAAGLCLGESVPATAKIGTAAAESGPIAYEALGGDIYTIFPDGTGNRQILPAAQQPAWSSDGERLAYVIPLYGSAVESGLWWARPDGTRPHLIITPEQVRQRRADVFSTDSPAWAPGGRRLAFTAVYEVLGEDDVEYSVSLLATVAIDGTALRILRRGRSPAWFPNGRRIAFITSRNRIATVKPDGTGFRVLVRDARPLDIGVSRDGRKLLYGEFDQGGVAIRILNLKTRRTTTIPSRKLGLILAATMTPSGKRIAYLKNPPAGPGQPVSPTAVYTIRLDGSGNRRLFTLPALEGGGMWATNLAWRIRR
jgi:Tol biopolymer transport system component